jgi:hypothetical protein
VSNKGLQHCPHHSRRDVGGTGQHQKFLGLTHKVALLLIFRETKKWFY